MAANPLKNPPGLTITGGNWCHEGWLYGLLGLDLPRFTDPDYPVSDVDIDAFVDGYDMAQDTDLVLTLSEIIRRMVQLGQLTIVPNPPEPRRHD